MAIKNKTKMRQETMLFIVGSLLLIIAFILFHYPKILDYINPLIRDKLRKANNVVIVETILENIKDCYMASMQIVDKIPVDWGQIGLKTWEELALQA